MQWGVGSAAWLCMCLHATAGLGEGSPPLVMLCLGAGGHGEGLGFKNPLMARVQDFKTRLL